MKKVIDILYKSTHKIQNNVPLASIDHAGD